MRPLIAGLETRCRAKILVAELRCACRTHSGLDLRVHLEQAEVLDVDEGPIVGLDLSAHIQTTEPISSEQGQSPPPPLNSPRILARLLLLSVTMVQRA